MKKIEVIKNVPTKLPISKTILYIFLLNYYNVDRLYIGIFGVIWAWYIIIHLAAWLKEESIDVLNEPKDGAKKSVFQEKLEEMALKRGFKPKSIL